MISNYGRIINESVAIAEKSANSNTVLSRLDVAIDAVSKLAGLAEQGVVLDRSHKKLVKLAAELESRKFKADADA